MDQCMVFRDTLKRHLYNSGSGLLMYPVGTALNFRTHSDSNAIIGGTNTVGISIINRSAINLLTVLHNDSTYTYTTTVASPYVPTKAIGITLFARHRINCFLAMDYVDRQLMSDAIKQFNTELGRAV